MAKRVREGQNVSFEQQLKAFKPLKVNPFSLMMEAARTAAHQDAASQQAAGAHCQQQQQQQLPSSRQHPTGAQHYPGCHVPCSHCGVGLSELSVQQCHSCKNVYCASCSVINYEAREDRVFCLDCLPGTAATCCSREDDDCEMHDQLDRAAFDQFDRPAFDLYRSASPSRDITGCGQPGSSGSGRSSSLMQACHRAAAAAAASAAANGSTPFSSMAGDSAEQGCGGLFAMPHMNSGPRPAAAAAPWEIGGTRSPSSLAGPGRAGGQLLATSPVIPFVGLGCGQGYMGLASRVCGAAV